MEEILNLRLNQHRFSIVTNKDNQFNPDKLPLFEAGEELNPALQKDFFKFAVESLNIGVWLIHRDSETVYVNKAACDSLGYEADDLIGKYVHEWDPLFPEGAWPGYMQQLREHKYLHFETRHTTRTGEVFPVEIHAHYYSNDGEEFSLAFVSKKHEL